MDGTEAKLDFILEGIRSSEEHIFEMKRKTDAVQMQIGQDVKEAEKRKEESIRMESETVAARLQVASLEARLLINEQLKSDLEEQTSMKDVEVEEKQKSLEIMEQTRKEMLERFLVEGKNFYNWVRLDNPGVLIRRKALKQEAQQLDLEKTRILCEIKVLEDNMKELESLQAEKLKYEEEIYDMNMDKAQRETDLNRRLSIAQLEKDKLLDPNCPFIERLTEELKCIQEEGEYLQSALQAMKMEHHKVFQELRVQESNKVSRPLGTVEPWSHSRHQPLNIVNPQQWTTNSESFPGNVSSTQDNTETVLQDVSWSSAGNNISSASSQNFTKANENNIVRSHGHKFTCLAGSSSNSLLEGARLKTGNISNVKSGGFVGTSTYQAKVTPSTPRTFTRNPPPPTPESEKESRPGQPVHLVGHFSCLNASEEESDETQDTQDLASVRNHSISTGKASIAPFRQPSATTAFSIQKPKPAGQLGKGNSKKQSPNNSVGSSLLSTPQGDFVTDHSRKTASDAPAKTATASAHDFAPGWASMSLDIDQDIPEGRSMSHHSKEDSTFGRYSQYNESIEASAFAPNWASMSVLDTEDSSRKVSDCTGMYRSNTNRSGTQDVQGNSAYAKDFSKSGYTRNSTDSQLFMSNSSMQGNTFQNDQNALHFKFRKTTVQVETPMEKSSSDYFRQNSNRYSNQNPGTGQQQYPYHHNRNRGYIKPCTSQNFRPQGRGYKAQRGHDNHVSFNKN